MKKLFLLLPFILFGGCATAAQKAKAQADFNAQFNLLTPEQQHQMYYEAFKDAYGIGQPPAPPPVFYPTYQQPIYTPPQNKVCYPNGFGGISCT